jgi:prepilin-type N-terminal cleavage/methylation domain-containing protein
MPVKSDDGFTLIEMLVTLLIGTIVMLGAFQLVDTAFPAAKRVDDRVDATQRGRVVMENMVRQLRASVCLQNGKDTFDNPTFATPYVSATGNQVTFYSDLTTSANVAARTFVPEKRQLSYSSGTITQTVWAGVGTQVPDITYDDAHPTSVRTLITGVQPIGSTPIFTYYAYDATKTIQKLADPPPVADIPRIERIDLALRVLPTGGTNPGAGVDMQDTANTRVGSDFTLNTSGQSNAQRGPQCSF